jgi:hypothetical protein
MSSFSEAAGKQRANQDRLYAKPMAWKCAADGFVEFFHRRWLKYTGWFLDNALGWGWTVAIHADDLSRCAQ